MSQQGHYFHSESMHLASTDICLRNICPVITSSGNGTILDCHYILDAHDIYLHQQFQPAAPLWPDQQLNSYNNDDHALAWHLSLPILPYVQAHSANGSSENARIGPQIYHDTTGRRSGHRFPHPPPQYHSFHQHAQEIRCHSFNFHPPITAPSYRVPTNPSSSSSVLIHDAIEIGARHPGHVPFVGAHIHQSHRGNMQEATLRHQNHPPATVFLDDDVALLVDHHTDMHLDPEDMSYEELLALGERIGNEKSGLSENIITSQMKTKTYLRSISATNLEEAASEEQEVDLCIICQHEYKNQEKIGILRCGHEYHTDCLKKWLLEKNVCPICKSVALTLGEKCV